jgi:hypothetical protein
MIGFVITKETSPGVWTPTVTEKRYPAEITKNVLAVKTADFNDNISMSNVISIIGDPFAYENPNSIRYATYMGVKWKVTNIEVERPRLILTVGGEYNGES